MGFWVLTDEKSGQVDDVVDELTVDVFDYQYLPVRRQFKNNFHDRYGFIDIT